MRGKMVRQIKDMVEYIMVGLVGIKWGREKYDFEIEFGREEIKYLVMVGVREELAKEIKDMVGYTVEMVGILWDGCQAQIAVAGKGGTAIGLSTSYEQFHQLRVQRYLN